MPFLGPWSGSAFVSKEPMTRVKEWSPFWLQPCVCLCFSFLGTLRTQLPGWKERGIDFSFQPENVLTALTLNRAISFSCQPSVHSQSIFWFLKRFLKDFIYLFLERGKGGRKRGREISVVASHMPPTRDMARNAGMCPHPEPNLWPFSLQNDGQPTVPHQSGLIAWILLSALVFMHFPRISLFTFLWPYALTPSKPRRANQDDDGH